MKVIDVSGVVYELISVGQGKIRLENQRYKEISHDYKKQFIEDAMRSGLLKPVDGKLIQFTMRGVR